jgi:hypothetical protein
MFPPYKFDRGRLSRRQIMDCENCLQSPGAMVVAQPQTSPHLEIHKIEIFTLLAVLPAPENFLCLQSVVPLPLTRR